MSAPLPGYVGTVGTASSTTTGSSGVITLGPTTTVQQNHLVVVTLEMLAKSANGAVAATDTAGNTYTVARSVTVSGGRLVVLTGLTAKPLPAGAKITVTFPGATAYRMVADDLLGVTKVDQVASATGTSQSFSSGSTLPTKAAREVVFGAVSTFTSSSNPTWTSAWTALTPQAAASTNLGRAYQLPTASRHLPGQRHHLGHVGGPRAHLPAVARAPRRSPPTRRPPAAGQIGCGGHRGVIVPSAPRGCGAVGSASRSQ